MALAGRAKRPSASPTAIFSFYGFAQAATVAYSSRDDRPCGLISRPHRAPVAVTAATRRSKTPRSIPRRDLILDAARNLLSEKGMRAFTVKNVAHEAGVSAALVIYHFRGINDLLEAVCDSVMFELPDTAEFPPADLNQALANLVLVVERYFDPAYYSRKSLLVWLPLFQAMVLDEEFRKKIYARDEAYISGFAVHIARVAEFRGLDIDATEVARNLMSFMDGLWLRWCHSNRADTVAEHRAAVEYLEGKVGPLPRADAMPAVAHAFGNS